MTATHGPRRHQTRADKILGDLDHALRDGRTALNDWGAWRAQLASWANAAGYPTGGSGGGSGHGDPTAGAALATDPMLHELAGADRDLERLAGAVREALSAVDSLVRRRAWVVNPAKPVEKPHLVYCENPRCQERIREEAGEKAREGRCNRCDVWQRRYGREYPMKEVVRRGA